MEFGLPLKLRIENENTVVSQNPWRNDLYSRVTVTKDIKGEGSALDGKLDQVALPTLPFY